VRIASIFRVIAPLKRWSTSKWLHDATSQKILNFRIGLDLRNYTPLICYLLFISPHLFISPLEYCVVHGSAHSDVNFNECGWSPIQWHKFVFMCCFIYALRSLNATQNPKVYTWTAYIWPISSSHSTMPCRSTWYFCSEAFYKFHEIFHIFSVSFTCDKHSVSWCNAFKYPLNSMKRSPCWETNSCSASHGVSSIIWNANYLYRVRRSSPLVFIMSQVNSVHRQSLCSPCKDLGRFTSEVP
jgi:hypothetical protein